MARVCSGETGLFELLMRRHNQRVYRIGRAVLRDDIEAEELTQEAWVRAFTHLSQFETRSRFSTWLARIAIHEAWARARGSRRLRSLEAQNPDIALRTIQELDPEREAERRQLHKALESAIDSLPAVYRTVFVLREIEGMSTEQTAESLELTKGAVKVRLHRARALLRLELRDTVGLDRRQTFPFLGSRCDRMVRSVFALIQSAAPQPS